MSFANWLSAPFLKELSGKQLYEVMVAIKDGGVTGECECYVENGNAFVLRFLNGQPTFERDKVAEVLKRKSVVCAWMPGKTAGTATSNLYKTVRDQIEPLLHQDDLFTSGDRWLILLHQTDVVISSERGDAAGGKLATALAAQINGAFRDITNDKPLQRFSLDFGGTRFGFETVGGGWSVVYRIEDSRQPDVRQCTTTIRERLGKYAGQEASFAMKSAATDRNDAKYCLVRPQTYQRVEAEFRKFVEQLHVPWDCFWFQYDSDVTYMGPRGSEGQQEIGGAFGQLNGLVCQGFERLTNRRATNFVLYADGITIWCDFFDKGFWATRFSDDKKPYRHSAENAAKKGWEMAAKAFAKKTAS